MWIDDIQCFLTFSSRATLQRMAWNVTRKNVNIMNAQWQKSRHITTACVDNIFYISNLYVSDKSNLQFEMS